MIVEADQHYLQNQTVKAPHEKISDLTKGDIDSFLSSKF